MPTMSTSEWITIAFAVVICIGIWYRTRNQDLTIPTSTEAQLRNAVKNLQKDITLLQKEHDENAEIDVRHTDLPLALLVLPDNDLDVQKEKAAIYLSGLRHESVRPPVTKSSLLSAIERTFPDILHVGAHANNEGVILDDGIAIVGWWRNILNLATLRENPFHLVFLNACQSLDIVNAMVEGGVKSTVGMSEDISDEAAIQFAGEFYKHLLRGMPVDNAAQRAGLTLSYEDSQKVRGHGKWRIR
jgi:CHAT domain-containing protein